MSSLKHIYYVYGYYYIVEQTIFKIAQRKSSVRDSVQGENKLYKESG